MSKSFISELGIAIVKCVILSSIFWSTMYISSCEKQVDEPIKIISTPSVEYCIDIYRNAEPKQQSIYRSSIIERLDDIEYKIDKIYRGR